MNSVGSYNRMVIIVPIPIPALMQPRKLSNTPPPIRHLPMIAEPPPLPLQSKSLDPIPRCPHP